MKFKIIVCSFLLVTSVVWAGEEEESRDFGFRPLEIYRFKPSTIQLKVEDINADGLDDVIFANNRDSRLEILIRKKDASWEEGSLPTLEDAFENRGVIVDQSLRAVRLVNLNSDKKTDILTFGSTLGLQKRIQIKDGSFGRPEKIYVEKPNDIMVIQADDLNRDGMADIVVARRDSLEILWNDKKQSFRNRDKLPLSTENCRSLKIADINHDKNPDLLIYFNSSGIPLKVRLGDGKGEFGLEYPLELPSQRYVRLLNKDNGSKPQLGCVLKNGLGVRLYDFVMKKQPELLESDEVVPQMIALSGGGKNGAPAWTVADINRDDYDDMLVSAPELSQLHLYFGSKDGLEVQPKEIDTLSSIDSIDMLGDSGILVVSKGEKSAAIHNIKKLSEFPVILDLPGEMVVGTSLRGKDRMFFVTRNKARKFTLFETGPGGKDPVGYQLDLENDPESILAMDFGDDGVGVLIFRPYASPVMHRIVKGELKIVEVADFRALSYTMKKNHVSFLGDDDKSLVVSYKKTARVFEWSDGRFSVKRQFNPGNDSAEVVASCRYLGKDGGRVIYDREARALSWYSDDVSKESVKVHLKQMFSEVSGLVYLKSGKQYTMAVIGAKDIGLIMSGKEQIVLEPGPEYMSPSEKPTIMTMNGVMLGPMRPMLAIIETANRSLELVSILKKGSELKKELIFEVYVDAGFSSRSKRYSREPRSVESGDLNGDKIGDLVLLVHDKLLIYLGE
ncbi:hypothetical protein BVX94_04030 [bacterium B17]|nr:hypothetical protein BVX94_04030 [bacterium B17]